MATLKAVTLADIVWIAYLYDYDGTLFDLTSPSDWTVKAALFDRETEAIVGTTATIAKADSETAGGDWSAGKLAVLLAPANSNGVDSGRYGLEVYAVNGESEMRWHHDDVQLTKGLIPAT